MALEETEDVRDAADTANPCFLAPTNGPPDRPPNHVYNHRQGHRLPLRSATLGVSILASDAA